MKIKYNRFALFPVQCDICQNYIWLERYRCREAYFIYSPPVKDVYCKECYEKVLEKKENETN